jgi:hypothetical protein
MDIDDFAQTAEKLLTNATTTVRGQYKLPGEIKAALYLAYKMGVQECWDAVNDRIEQGQLPGNGVDKTAERNGLILATNLIAALESK